MTKINTVYITPYISYISGEVRISLGLTDTNSKQINTLSLDYPYILDLCYFSDNYIDYLNKNMDKFSTNKILQLSDYYIKNNKNPEILYCPYCRTQLFSIINNNIDNRSYCVNINCTTNKFLENLHYKFNMLLDNDLNLLFKNANLINDIVVFLYNNVPLIDAKIGSTNINDIFITIKNLIDNPVYKLQKIYNDLLKTLYNNYKNMSIYTFFKLTKIPQQFDDEIENLKSIKLRNCINTNGVLSYIFDSNLYSKEFYKCYSLIAEINKDFLKNFYLYII